MSFAAKINNAIFKRPSTFGLAIVASVFFFERTFDVAADAIFDRINEGKLWKHIKHNYEK